ncbi:putative pyridoxal-dependent aspartate 1-decarboxylase [Niabella terrae]
MNTGNKKFSELGYKIIDLIQRDLQQSAVPESKTLNWSPPAEELEFWTRDFNAGEAIAAEDLFQQLLDHSIHLNNPGYMGHQVPPTAALTILTSALVAYLNNGMAVYEMGMAGNAMEQVVIRYFAECWGMPPTTTGIITSGGSLGNLTCLLAARTRYLARHPEAAYQQLAVMVSAEAHYSIERAFMVMGLPLEQIIRVETDAAYRLQLSDLPGKLQQARDNNLLVFALIGCACSTSTGSFDDLQALADFARAHDIWFHVDAAHGGATVFSEKYGHLLQGIGQADSVIMDFHKMMQVPSLSTLVLFQTPAHHRGTFQQHASYLWQDQDHELWYQSGKQTFECTKSMSVFHVYALLRLYGAEFFRQHIDRLYDTAAAFSDLLTAAADFELRCPPQSNIVCFRFIQPGSPPDSLNQFIVRELVRQGYFYVVSVQINGGFYIRTSIMNPRTSLDDFQGLIRSIRDIAGKFTNP